MRSFITILLMLCSLTILAELSDKTSSILVAQEFGSTNKDLPNLLEKRRQKKEIPAIIVKGEALRTGENEKAATISVRLNVRPIANVTVSATSSDGTEGSLLKSTLEFTPENWDLFQKFDVIGVDDEIVDPEEEYEVILNVGSVSDFRFSQIEKRALKIINQDNDKAGFEVNKVEEATTEGGRKTSFRLRLTSKPSSRVGLSFKTDRSSEGKMITDRISFSPDNWNQFQPVFVQGVDDFVQDGTQKYRILPGNAVSSDGDYKGLRFPPVTVLNNDNDRAAILAATSKNQTSESGGFSVVKIRLNSEPVADVKVLVSTSEQSEGKPNPDTLVFNSKNWNKEQVLKVIGSDDFLKDGDQPYKIDFSAISKGDSNYANLRSVALAFINKDNDVPGFVINEIQSYSSEKGEKAQFNVRLTTKPKANVTIGLKSDNPKEGRLIRKSLVFTPDDWDLDQFVYVVGVDDGNNDNDQRFKISILPAISRDNSYNGLDPEDVQITNKDDDQVGIRIGKVEGDTTENKGKTRFPVQLLSQPNAPVTLSFQSTNPKEGKVVTENLVFNGKNWEKPQWVVLEGVNDERVDGDVPYQIKFAPTKSDDPRFSHMELENVNVINRDNNKIDFEVLPVSAISGESGKAAIFHLSLRSRPKAKVLFNLLSDRPDEGVPSKKQIEISPETWKKKHEIIIKGTNDFVQDGEQQYHVSIQPESLLDQYYNRLPAKSVNIVNTDDDQAGISVKVLSKQSDERGKTADFSVKLNSEPLSPVVFIFHVNRPNEVKMVKQHAAFDKSNWNKNQIISSTGVEDHIIDQEQLFTVFSKGAVSEDPLYNNMTFATLKMSNQDRDVANFIVSKVDKPTSEYGDTVDIQIRLNTIPRHPVSMKVSSGNPNEGHISPGSITFQPDDWNKDQTLTVTGVDDNIKDIDQKYQIHFAPSTSEDEYFEGIQAQSVELVNLDNRGKTWGVSLYYHFFTGEIKDTFDPALGTKVTASFLLNEQLDTEASIGAISIPGKNTIYAYNRDNYMEYDYQEINIEGGGRYLFVTSPFGFYGNAGLGLYSWSLITDNTTNITKKETASLDLGAYLGSGLDVAILDGWSVEFETRMNFISGGLGNQQFNSVATTVTKSW